MKMEHMITSTRRGVISSINMKKGKLCAANELLCTLQSDDQAPTNSLVTSEGPSPRVQRLLDSLAQPSDLEPGGPW